MMTMINLKIMMITTGRVNLSDPHLTTLCMIMPCESQEQMHDVVTAPDNNKNSGVLEHPFSNEL